MSSPPAPIFPTTYSPSTLTLKRPIPPSQLSNPAKRRKASTSSSTHPLRQASFPPPDGPGPQSPSGSAISYGTGAGRVRASYSPSVSVDGGKSQSVTSSRAPGRKSKKSKQQGAGGNAESASAVSGATKRSGRAREASASVVGAGSKVKSADARSTTGARAGAEDEEDEDDEGDEENENEAIWQGSATDAGDDAEDRENLGRLIDGAFSPEQYEQYTAWRRARLDKTRIKKLVNSTLSQSVSDGIVTAVMGVTKMFVGELVEGARRVQDEWLAAAERLPTGERNSRYVQKNDAAVVGEGLKTVEKSTQDSKGDEVDGRENGAAEQNGTTQDTSMPDAPSTQSHNSTSQPSGFPTEPDSSHNTQDTNGTKSSSFTTQESTRPISPPTSPPKQPRAQYKPLVQERDRGPLTPDHLREALRRYKKDREGGSVGWQGMSLQGLERTAPRVSGRRLFR